MMRKAKAFFYLLRDRLEKQAKNMSENGRTKKCVVFLGLLSASAALIALALYEPPSWQNIAVAALAFYLATAVALAIVRGQSLRW